MTNSVTITLDAAKCKRDSLCARVCPARIFRHEPKALPSIERTHDCVLCKS